MAAELIYKGGKLDSIVSEWVEKHSREYKYFVEIARSLPIGELSDWATRNLPRRLVTIAVKHAPARRMHMPYFCVVPMTRFVGTTNYLVGFVAPEDRALVAERFKEFVIYEEPFMTRFSVSDASSAKRLQ